MTYNVFGGTLNLTQLQVAYTDHRSVFMSVHNCGIHSIQHGTIAIILLLILQTVIAHCSDVHWTGYCVHRFGRWLQVLWDLRLKREQHFAEKSNLACRWDWFPLEVQHKVEM